MAGFVLAAGAPGTPLPYRNPHLSVDARVRDLLRRMTPEEKFWQLFMYPQAIGLAATWDPALVGRVAEAIASETILDSIRRKLATEHRNLGRTKARDDFFGGVLATSQRHHGRVP